MDSGVDLDGRRAPAADSANALYITPATAPWTTIQTLRPNTDLGDSVLKLTTSSGLSSERLVLPV